jgi:hypothetical protein
MADRDRPSKTPSESALTGDDLYREKGGASDLLHALGAFIKESLTLLALEGRLAIVSAIVMVAAGVFAAVLLVSAWLLLLAALAVALVSYGWPWTGVLVCLAAANAIVALVCWFLIRHLSRNLLFTATLRNLRFKNTQSPDHAQTRPT